jgi:hypothetical protein
MNNKTFVILLRWVSPLNAKLDTIQAQFGGVIGASAWLRFSHDAYLLKTNPFVTAPQIHTAIDLKQAELEQILIFEVDKNSRYGWCPEWVWEWIAKE